MSFSKRLDLVLGAVVESTPHMDDSFRGLENLAANPMKPNMFIKDLGKDEKLQLEDHLKSPTGPNEVIVEATHNFDKEMKEFNAKFEEQINAHINSNAYTDRKLSGSIIGTSVFGGTGFLVF